MKDYTKYSFTLTATVLILLSVVSFISPVELFGFRLKQANLYSDVVSDSALRTFAALPTQQKAMIDNINAKFEDKIESLYHALDSIKLANDSARLARISRLAKTPAGVVAIQDFSENNFLLEPFYKALDNASKNRVRIAVLGDSFIEGDIMTSDLRELFQNEYKGAGVGFMPVTSQVSKFRATAKHDFDNSQWQQYSVLKESSRGDYMLSGYTFVPKTEGCWVEYAGSKFRKHLNRFGKASFIFINKGNTRIKVTVNGSVTEEFTPASSDQLQFISMQNDTINKVRFEFSNIEGFTAYGALLDGKTGVSLDNYSVRGNSGVTMTALNNDICRQMSQNEPYDLIILEYGLNVISEEVTDYSYYRKQFVSVVEHIKECFPGVPVLIMGVSDRSTMNGGEYVTMPGVTAMNKMQRDVAKQCKIAFWSALDAMRSMGGMAKFVENGWAAKDYTHLGTKGGQMIARKLFESIENGR